MSRDWDQELTVVRQEIRETSDGAKRAEAMVRGADLVRAYIRAQGVDRRTAIDDRITVTMASKGKVDGND